MSVYCGQNKTALTSQHRMGEALYALMTEKPYAEISVSELCRRAGVSRQTFYTLYGTRENIIIAYLQQILYDPDTQAAQGPAGFQLEDFCLQFSRYLIANRAFLALLARNGILYLLFESMYRAMVDCASFDALLPDRDRRYVSAFIAGGFMGVAQAYIERDAAEDEAALKEELRMLFRGEYIPRGTAN